MIIRLVTMTFEPQDVQTFLKLFSKYQDEIRSFDGCSELKLIQNSNNAEEISTISNWSSEKKLNNYRSSDIFKIVWPQTKKLFKSKPKATTFCVLTNVALKTNEA